LTIDNAANYQICSRTVMDTSDPAIFFDQSGISNHALDFENHVLPHWHPNAFGASLLNDWVERIKDDGKNQEFDCILGLSGGLDSSFMLHEMVTKHGLRPLVFHVDGGWNSEAAVHNINVLVDKLGVELFTEVIDWEEMKDFQLAFLKSGVPHVDTPQDHAFVAVLYRYAQSFKIRTILNGGNIASECVKTPFKYFYWGTDLRQIRDITRKFGSRRMEKFPFSSPFYHKFYLRYLRGVRVLKPLNMMPYNKKFAEKTLEDSYGWRAFPQKHFESEFTRFFEGYWLPKRFGFDVRRVQLSSLILSGQLSREEALNMLAYPAIPEDDVQRTLEYVASKLSITAERLAEYEVSPKKYYFDYKNQNKIFMAAEYFMTKFSTARRGGAF